MRRVLPMLVLLAACTPSSTAPTAPSGETATGPGIAPSNAVAIEIEAVLDGDSIRATLDGEPIEIRLIGINAPERDECWADESRTALAEGVTAGDVTLVAEGTDQYGRRLGYLHAGGTNLNRRQIVAGNAVALATDHDLLPDFLAAEEEAAALERGLWGRAPCGPSRAADIVIWAIEPDPAGRDDQNPNGEFVAITNEGDPADLSGWVLRDESSVHRFSFPDGFVIDHRQIVTIRTGCGTDTATDLHWCADGTVWTNSGDTVLLLDESGAIAARERYFGN